VDTNNTPQNGGDTTKQYPLQERSSIDTLVARLGILEVADSKQDSRKPKRERHQEPEGTPTRPPRRINRPPTWDRIEGPLLSVPGDSMASGEGRSSKRPTGNRPQRPPPEKKSFWASLCCGSADDDYVEVVRHKWRVAQPAMSDVQVASTAARPQYPDARTFNQSNGQLERPPPRPSMGFAAQSQTSTPSRKPLGEKPARPINKSTPSAK
jgi:hypothetical protein